jgi:hypothetical protein
MLEQMWSIIILGYLAINWWEQRSLDDSGVNGCDTRSFPSPIPDVHYSIHLSTMSP